MKKKHKNWGNNVISFCKKKSSFAEDYYSSSSAMFSRDKKDNISFDKNALTKQYHCFVSDKK